MKAKKFAAVASLIVALVFAFGAPWQMQAQDAKNPYPTSMAPLDQYLMDRDAEIIMLNPQFRDGPEPITEFTIPVGKWSDGTAAPAM
jgi:hypothetical protein